MARRIDETLDALPVGESVVIDLNRYSVPNQVNTFWQRLAVRRLDVNSYAYELCEEWTFPDPAAMVNRVHRRASRGWKAGDRRAVIECAVVAVASDAARAQFDEWESQIGRNKKH